MGMGDRLTEKALSERALSEVGSDATFRSRRRRRSKPFDWGLEGERGARVSQVHAAAASASSGYKPQSCVLSLTPDLPTLLGLPFQVLDEFSEKNEHPWRNWRPLSAHVDKLSIKKAAPGRETSSGPRPRSHHHPTLVQRYNHEFSRPPVTEVRVLLPPVMHYTAFLPV